jgi:hypothetical protein
MLEDERDRVPGRYVAHRFSTSLQCSQTSGMTEKSRKIVGISEP